MFNQQENIIALINLHEKWSIVQPQWRGKKFELIWKITRSCNTMKPFPMRVQTKTTGQRRRKEKNTQKKNRDKVYMNIREFQVCHSTLYVSLPSYTCKHANHPTYRFNPSGQPSSRSRHRNSAYGFAPVDPNLHLDIPGPVDEWGLVMVNLGRSAEFDVRKIFGFPKGGFIRGFFCVFFFWWRLV